MLCNKNIYFNIRVIDPDEYVSSSLALKCFKFVKILFLYTKCSLIFYIITFIPIGLLEELEKDLETCGDVYTPVAESPATFFEVFSDTDNDDEIER